MIKLKLMICIILSSLVCCVGIAGQIPFGFFRADPASGCAGVSMYGYCYYLATAANTTCDAVCSTRGGCVVAGLDRVGQNGTSPECSSLLTALGLPAAATSNVSNARGCAYNNSIGERYRSTIAASCATSTQSGVSRHDTACACAN